MDDKLRPSPKRQQYLKLSGIIMRSKLYTQGGSFAASDVMSKLHGIKADEARDVLARMVDEGHLMEVARHFGGGQTGTSYAQKSAEGSMIKRRRLAYYVPPTPERVRHYHAWLRSSVAYELNSMG